MSNDMQQYLDLFLMEAREQLEILEQETLHLERDPSIDRLQIIFRAAHTIKGSARAMGFSNFANLTHEVENVLDLMRSGQLEVNTEIADAVLLSIDVLSKIAEMIADGEGDTLDCSDAIARVVRARDGGSSASSSESAAAPEALTPVTSAQNETAAINLPAEVVNTLELAAERQAVYHASITLQPDCAIKFARAFMALNIVNDGGELLASIPSPQEIEDEQFDQNFEFFFIHKLEIDQLQAKLGSIVEVERLDLKVWGAPPSSATVPQAESASPGGVPVAAAQVNPSTPPVTPGSTTPSSGAPEGKKKSDSGQTVRVDVSRLDELMNLVGELVIDRTRIADLGQSLYNKFPGDPEVESLREMLSHVTRTTSDLQDNLMKVRMLQIETVFNRFPRMVRDLAQKMGKNLELVMEGGETELDRSVIEVIGDPLIHIIRNSIDHGIESPDERRKAGKPEQGTIHLSARHQENHIVIEIRDDGHGIDPAKLKEKAIEKGILTADAASKLSERDTLQLIFASGFSTAATVSEVSGRGVGMDIVRTNIQRLGGLVDLETVVGQGSKFTLRLPLTLAIIRGLLVGVETAVYVLPLASVIETLALESCNIKRVHKSEVMMLRSETMPLIRMKSVFPMKGYEDSRDVSQQYVVVVGLADKRLGLVVDRLVGEQEVVIKSIPRYCGDISGISGATILGDGSIGLICDVNSLVERLSRA